MIPSAFKSRRSAQAGLALAAVAIAGFAAFHLFGGAPSTRQIKNALAEEERDANQVAEAMYGADYAAVTKSKIEKVLVDGCTKVRSSEGKPLQYDCQVTIDRAGPLGTSSVTGPIRFSRISNHWTPGG